MIFAPFGTSAPIPTNLTVFEQCHEVDLVAIEPIVLDVQEKTLEEVLDFVPKDGKVFYLLTAGEEPSNSSRDYMEEVAEMMGFKVVAVRLKV